VEVGVQVAVGAQVQQEQHTIEQHKALLAQFQQERELVVKEILVVMEECLGIVLLTSETAQVGQEQVVQ
jgi:hypothetical protein